MQIKMTRDTKASVDGVHILPLAAGKLYDLPEGLAQAFIAQGWGTDPKQQAGPRETKRRTRVVSTDGAAATDPTGSGTD